MNKYLKRGLIISISVTVGLLFIYTGGSLIGAGIANKNMCQNRGSTTTNYQDFRYQYQNTYKDYALMQNVKEVTFSSSVSLKGYYYEVDNPLGLIISIHGFKGFALDTTTQYQNYFLEKGYNVFAFDLMGHGASDGDGIGDFYQSKIDIINAYNYLKESNLSGDLPVFLVGYSLGAYGAIIASEEIDVKAVVSFSSYDKPAELYLSTAEDYVNGDLSFFKPGLDLSLLIENGLNYFSSASEVIKRNQNTKYIVIQGDKDNYVSMNKYSLYARVKDLNLENTTIYPLENITHMDPWKSYEAHQYEDGIKDQYQELLNKYNRAIPNDIYQDFLSSINKEKASELNISLVDDIYNIFLNN